MFTSDATRHPPVPENDGRDDSAADLLDMAFCGRASVREFFIARQHTDARYWYSKSVCPFVDVCPSITFRYQMKTA